MNNLNPEPLNYKLILVLDLYQSHSMRHINKQTLSILPQSKWVIMVIAIIIN